MVFVLELCSQGLLQLLFSTLNLLEGFVCGFRLAVRITPHLPTAYRLTVAPARSSSPSRIVLDPAIPGLSDKQLHWWILCIRGLFNILHELVSSLKPLHALAFLGGDRSTLAGARVRNSLLRWFDDPVHCHGPLWMRGVSGVVANCLVNWLWFRKDAFTCNASHECS